MTGSGQLLPRWTQAVLPLPRSGKQVTLEASEAERARIAAEFSLQEVASFKADIVLKPWSAGGVKLEGRLRADVVQSCVITFAPVPEQIDARFTRRFYDPRRKTRHAPDETAREVDVGLEDDDPAEPLEGNSLDLAPLLLEELALALNPYPRAGGARLEQEPAPGQKGQQDEKRSPFDVLRVLKPKDPGAP